MSNRKARRSFKHKKVSWRDFNKVLSDGFESMNGFKEVLTVFLESFNIINSCSTAFTEEDINSLRTPIDKLKNLIVANEIQLIEIQEAVKKHKGDVLEDDVNEYLTLGDSIEEIMFGSGENFITMKTDIDMAFLALKIKYNNEEMENVNG